MPWDTAEAHTNDTEIIAGVDVEYNVHKWWYLRERLLLIHHQSLWTEYEYQFYALKLSLEQAFTLGQSEDDDVGGGGYRVTKNVNNIIVDILQELRSYWTYNHVVEFLLFWLIIMH